MHAGRHPMRTGRHPGMPSPESVPRRVHRPAASRYGIRCGRLHAHRTVPWYGTQSHPLEFRRFRSATVPRYGTQALGGRCCGSVPYHTRRADAVRRNRPPCHAARHRVMAFIVMRHRPPPRYDVRRHATAPTITRRRSPLHGTIRHRAATSHTTSIITRQHPPLRHAIRHRTTTAQGHACHRANSAECATCPWIRSIRGRCRVGDGREPHTRGYARCGLPTTACGNRHQA